MPELPEIETIKLGLRKYLVGHKIEAVQVKIAKMFSGEKKNILGAKIVDLRRIGKGLILELDNGYVLAVHLKMTGQLVYRDAKTQKLPLSVKVGGEKLPSKYSHIIFALDNGAFLYYNDLRRFGWIKILKKDQLMRMPFFKDMGPEPKVGNDLAGSELTLNYFRQILQKGNLPIKVLLMDQKKIGGIGNIYANDALFDAKIDPRRSAKQILKKEAEKLYDSLFKVLRKSLEYGGSSDENFVNSLGQEGQYQNHALVYGRDKEKCRRCGSMIQKIKLGGRGTYFCPNCQR